MINPFKNKKGLGRGLSSLIGDSDITVTNNKISIIQLFQINFNQEKIWKRELRRAFKFNTKEVYTTSHLKIRRSR